MFTVIEALRVDVNNYYTHFKKVSLLMGFCAMVMNIKSVSVYIRQAGFLQGNQGNYGIQGKFSIKTNRFSAQGVTDAQPESDTCSEF